MKVELTEQSKQHLVYIQNYFIEKTNKRSTLSHYAQLAVSEFYNSIRNKELSNAKEQPDK